MQLICPVLREYKSAKYIEWTTLCCRIQYFLCIDSDLIHMLVTDDYSYGRCD